MKLTKEIIYLSLKDDHNHLLNIIDVEKMVYVEYDFFVSKIDVYFKSEQFVFTSEQLNEYTQNVIKQALETAAENATVTPIDHEEISEGSFRPIWGVDNDSITNTFEETFKKFKI